MNDRRGFPSILYRLGFPRFLFGNFFQRSDLLFQGYHLGVGARVHRGDLNEFEFDL